MSNYPDDIRQYDDDPRSPFHDREWICEHCGLGEDMCECCEVCGLPDDECECDAD